jgi:predicted TIM-barrel fold metal-dependent hydrolase
MTPITRRLDVRLVGGRVMVLAVALVLIAQAAAAQSALFDSHVHLWKGEESLRAYEEQLKKGRLEVEVVGIGAMWFGGPNQALVGRPTQIQAGNDGIIALAAKYPKMMPIATVHPYDGSAAVTELERVAAKGIKTLKLHPHTQKFDPDDPRVLTLVRRAGELSVIALIDNANILPGDSEKLFNLALKAPKTKFIFAHLGAMNFRFWNILKAARTAEGLFGDNIYFDISAIVVLVADSPIEDEFVWTMRNVGIDRVLLGSDYPQYSLEQNVSALGRLALDESEKAKIRYENVRALFGLR